MYFPGLFQVYVSFSSSDMMILFIADIKSTLQFAEEKLKTMLENNFYKCNVNLIEIMDFAKDACIQLELWEKAANYTEKVSKGIV